MEAPPFLEELLILVGAAALVAYLSQRLRIAPVAGFLVAGIAIGPNALGLVRSSELIVSAAELGILLLLFTIGIEFSLESLSRIRRAVLLGGSLQVLVTVALVTAILRALGVGWGSAVFTGFLAALSSTAIVLKLLSDRGEMKTPHGETLLAILVFQDLAVLAMMLLVPALAGEGGPAEVLLALGKAVVFIALVLVVARRVMPRLLEAVARTCSTEVFLLTVLGICIGSAYLFSRAGVSLSLGAFLAGLLVSESPFSGHALGEILPLKILFSAAFFVSVGLLVDVRFVLENLLLIGGLVAAVIAIKTVGAAAAVASLGSQRDVLARRGAHARAGGRVLVRARGRRSRGGPRGGRPGQRWAGVRRGHRDSDAALSGAVLGGTIAASCAAAAPRQRRVARWRPRPAARRPSPGPRARSGGVAMSSSPATDPWRAVWSRCCARPAPKWW